MDWLVGVPGLERGRRSQRELRVGHRIDSWQVVGVEPERGLTLGFGMKAPGAGVLEFELTPSPARRAPGRSDVLNLGGFHDR